MLCLMTLVDIEAVSPETLTPWKEELLWRLYVDTYNHLTQRYGDELIERNQAGLDEVLQQRPAGPVGRARSPGSSKACRSATCSSFRATRSTATSGWRATSSPTRCTCRSSATTASGRWRSSTLDKPFLFSNICGVLASFGMNILRGHALTNPNGLVLDVFQFTDDERFLELNPDAQAQVLRVLRGRRLGSGRRDRAAARAASRACLKGRAAVCAGRAGPTTKRRAATRSSTSSRATRSGCCIGSAASSRSTAATWTWC